MKTILAGLMSISMATSSFAVNEINVEVLESDNYVEARTPRQPLTPVMIDSGRTTVIERTNQSELIQFEREHEAVNINTDIRVMVNGEEYTSNQINDSTTFDASNSKWCSKQNCCGMDSRQRNIVGSIVATALLVGGVIIPVTWHLSSNVNEVEVPQPNGLLNVNAWNQSSDGMMFEPSNVFGPDDRFIERSGVYPYSAVGRIQGVTTEGSNYICSGSLVGEDMIVTAAHCVQDDDGNPYSSISFAAGMINGRANPNAVARVTRIWRSVNFPNFATGINIEYDWALAKLDRPLGKTQGWLGMRYLAFAEGEKINMAGYSGDVNFGNSMTVHLGCNVRDDEFQSYAVDCDSTGGSSGGPVTTASFRYVFAVNSHKYCGTDCSVNKWDEYGFNVRNVVQSVKDALITLNRLNNPETNQFEQLESTTPFCTEDTLKSPDADTIEDGNVCLNNGGPNAPTPTPTPTPTPAPTPSAASMNRVGLTVAVAVVLNALAVAGV